MNNYKHTAVMERNKEILRQKHEAGFVSKHFPEVKSITAYMTYNQKETRSIHRTLHFSPQSYAFFVVTCLKSKCLDGGFDLTEVITAMVKKRREKSQGTLNCKSTNASSSPSDIVYEVIIYTLHMIFIKMSNDFA